MLNRVTVEIVAKNLGIFILLGALCAPIGGNAEIPLSRPPQLIALAFDGSHTLEKWRETVDFARRQRAKGRRFAFTYFISGVAFLADKDRGNYHAPGKKPGQSEIDFGGTYDDIARRIELANEAHRDGHELASHANGHFNATKIQWTEANWLRELKLFDALVFGDLNHILRNGPRWDESAREAMIGFRAPYLATTPGMWPALKAAGYRYDTSRVREAGYWPQKKQGIWDFPLAEIPVAGTAKRTLSMDYNFYALQSRAKREGDESLRRYYEEQTLQSYLLYFTRVYNGNRAPMHIGHHFASFNGDAYNRALYRFADRVCGLPEVECVTYAELMNRLEVWGEARIARFQKKDFAHSEEELRFAVPPLAPLFIQSSLSLRDQVLIATLSGKDAASCRVRWYIDGKLVPGVTSPRLDLNTLNIQGTDAVEIRLSLTKEGREVFSQTRAYDPARGRLSGVDLEKQALLGDISDAH